MSRGQKTKVIRGRLLFYTTAQKDGDASLLLQGQKLYGAIVACGEDVAVRPIHYLQMTDPIVKLIGEPQL